MPRVKHPYIVAHSGAFLRSPRGGVENVPEMKAAGMDWLALNLGDGQKWDDWRIVITRARVLGMQVFPWARCRTLQECYDFLAEADLVGFRAILNIEDEFERDDQGGPAPCPPVRVAELLLDFSDVAVSFSTGGWLMNDVNYTPIAHRPVLLQVFPTDMRRDPAELPEITTDCVQHAHDKGFKHVGVTCQAYGAAEPEWYSYLTVPKSIYAGDDVGAGNWAAWA